MYKKIYYAIVTYVTLGLLAGLFYREFTKMSDFTGRTQLAFAHTHFLALGVLVFLAVLALEKLFRLSEQKTFRWFFITYNVGVLWTALMLVVKGVLQVQGAAMANSGMIAGISGLGHIILTAGFILLLVALKKQLWAVEAVA